MIPYMSVDTWYLGPIPIHVWGLFVALGVLAGTWLAARMARERGLHATVIWDLSFWCLLAGMIGARVFHAFVYRPDIYIADPLHLFSLQDGGYSSIGGFIGATIAGIIYLHKKQLDVWKYADTAVFGLPLGYAIGRIGCFLIHDHPGTATDFFAGVQYPDGIVRHDLGLYQAIDGAVLCVLFLILRKRKAPVGVYITVFLLWYGITRFFLEFLRASTGPIVDVRYGGLTPAQYAALTMVGAGAYTCRRLVKKPA